MGFVRSVEELEPVVDFSGTCHCMLPGTGFMSKNGFGEGTIWQCPDCGRVCVYVRGPENFLAWRDRKIMTSKELSKYLQPDAQPDDEIIPTTDNHGVSNFSEGLVILGSLLGIVSIVFGQRSRHKSASKPRRRISDLSNPKKDSGNFTG